MKLKFLVLSALFVFTSPVFSQFVLSGTATGGCDCYTLTTTVGNEAGSIWSPSTIDLTNPFDFTFNVYLGASDGGADGIVFVLRQSGTSTGGLGSLLGFSGITNSVGVEIDTWNSDPVIAPGDIPEDHLGMSANGLVNHGLVAAVPIANIEDGAFHIFRAIWDPIALELTINLDGVDIFTYTGDLVATYFGGVPDVYFGWTGSTGGSTNLQKVCMPIKANFTYEPENPCPGQEITFTNTSTSGLIYNSDTTTSWLWDFEPGATSILENPTYTFPALGEKSVDLTVTDISGCSADTTIWFDVRNLEPDITTSTNVTCFGDTDGSATVTIDPDDVDYTYLWDDPLAQTTETATNLPPGTYTVTVTNEFGCTGTDNVTIGEPSPVTLGGVTVNSSSCDTDDGSFILSGSGGTPGYQFSVNGSPFSAATSYTGLGGGWYYIDIKDAHGCIAPDSIFIESTGLALDYIYNPPTCYGFTDGSITLVIEGAGDGITFEIKDADGNLLNEDNSNTANSLGEGWYYFYVEDEMGCSQIDSLFIEQPGQLSADLTLVDVTCYGDETGWALVDTVLNWQGGYDQISYFWSPNPAGIGGLGADSSYNMGAGSYTLTINDFNGCSRVYDFEINEPDSLYFIEFDQHPAYCRLYNYQNGNGVLFGSAVGGVPDYDYLWTNLDNGATSVNSTWGGLNPGNYKLTVTDENGCILEQAVVLDSLNPEAIFTIESDQLNTDYQGTAPVEVKLYNHSINFANPYNPDADTVGFWNLFSPTGDWFLTDDITEVIDTIYEAKGGSYTAEICLVMVNKNGCSDTTCKIVTIYDNINFVGVNIFTPNGDGINDEFTFQYRATSISEFSCIIVNRWGKTVAELNDINASWNGTDKNGDPCSNGVYFYTYEGKTDNSTRIKGQGTVEIVGSK